MTVTRPPDHPVGVGPDPDAPRVRLVRSAASPEAAPTLAVVVDDTPVAEVLLAPGSSGGTNCDLRVLHRSLPDDAEVWGEVVAAFENYARDLGAVVLQTALPPALGPVFGAAGYHASLVALTEYLTAVPGFRDDHRVQVRTMTSDERRRFAADLPALLGHLDPDGALAAQARSAVTDPPPHELLMVGLVDGVPAARTWATVEQRADGALDAVGHAVDVVATHRGRGLLSSLLAAMNRHVLELGARGVAVHLPKGEVALTRALLDAGFEVADLHLRKDL